MSEENLGISEVKCKYCGLWFPSFFAFGSPNDLDSISFTDCSTVCLHCGKLTPYGKENMRIVSRDKTAGFRGKNTF